MAPHILQFCHCHYGPFLDVARQYAALFRDTPYKVTTVYLTDPASPEVETASASDEVVFLEFDSRAVKGLKLKAIRQFRRILAQRDYRLILAHRFKPIYISCLAGALPVIGVHHAYGDYERVTHRLFANRFRRRLSLLGVSDAIRDDIRKNLAKWPDDRIETLHNRIDVVATRRQLLLRDDARARLGISKNAYVIGNAGRLHPDKDQATLIEAFARARGALPEDSILLILGQGRLESQLQALTVQLGVAGQVRFAGQVPDARTLFRALDVFALSSDHEPFGMVVLEAMAAGVPVIATDCGGPPEILRGVGTLFPQRDVTALANQLIAHAGWSVAQRVDTADKYLERLYSDFSDEAAEKRFFDLAMVRQALGKLE